MVLVQGLCTIFVIGLFIIYYRILIVVVPVDYAAAQGLDQLAHKTCTPFDVASQGFRLVL